MQSPAASCCQSPPPPHWGHLDLHLLRVPALPRSLPLPVAEAHRMERSHPCSISFQIQVRPGQYVHRLGTGPDPVVEPHPHQPT